MAGKGGRGTHPPGRALPEAEITGYGNGNRFDPSGKSAITTGHARARALRSVLSLLVLDELIRSGMASRLARQLADQVFPDARTRGASGRHFESPQAARQAIAQVLAPQAPMSLRGGASSQDSLGPAGTIQETGTS